MRSDNKCDKCGEQYPIGLYAYFEHYNKCHPPMRIYGKLMTKKDIEELVEFWDSLK